MKAHPMSLLADPTQAQGLFFFLLAIGAVMGLFWIANKIADKFKRR